MTTPLLHITVGTGPESDPAAKGQFSVNLGHDLRIVKAALLYADKVTLCSPMSSLILTMLAARNLSLVQQLDLYALVAPMLLPGDAQQLREGLAALKSLAGKLYMSTEEEAFFRDFRQVFVGQWRTMQHILDEMRVQTGAGHLIETLNSGLVDLHPLSVEGTTDSLMDDFVQAIMAAVSSGETYPLFDEQVSGIVRASIRENLVSASPAAVARGKHTALAGNLLERLPLFDLATIDEIVDIRRALDKPLVRFRSAVIQFSERIKTAAWDEDFPIEADEAFRRDVEPAVQALEQELRANPYLLELTTRMVSRSATPVGSGVLTLALSSMTELPLLAATALGLAATAAANAVEAYWDRQRKQRQIEDKNQMFFYYKAGKLLQHTQNAREASLLDSN